MIVIKRYSNRKLYNTATRSYITLEELFTLAQDGNEIKIIDHTTGADITTAIMTQVLAQQEKQTRGLIPQALLEKMVQLSGLTLFSMRESMKAFTDPAAYIADDIQRRLDTLHSGGRITKEEHAHWLELLLDPELSPAFLQTEDHQAGASMDEVQHLLSQIDALEKEVAALEGKKKL